MIIIAAAITKDVVIRPIPNSSSSCGLVDVPPRVAPSGRVNTYADQNNTHPVWQ
jgi:hypothetical protein